MFSPYILLFCSLLHVQGLSIQNENILLDDNIQLFEGDIAVRRDQLGRNAYLNAPKWPNGILPYEIDVNGGYTQDQRNLILQSMKRIEDQTNNCIRFVQKTSADRTWIKIVNGQGCWSYFGKPFSNGFQELRLERPGCLYQNTIIHELLHAVGFAHEQSRPDRDGHVNIHWENIQAGQDYNFQSYSQGEVQLHSPYDIRSIMHYDWQTFSKNGQATLSPKDPNVPKEVMGSARELTYWDVQKVKNYYQCG
ncbi:unnamed protein product [Didymodactylos carnosus]|uniref:Metalloendopeptidase n=1 Tax=Didymodactylos carnosus TaxID=1234261 RepID=A0A814QRQ6_9BILA|nr:unnamed protein product [Didymodactylos carnosus]CAF1123984.1 unnamed protein product [Didymodactylos carnosus]CAF3850012.1 unnamed protein product [Didymodactylos carnosus]CAF3887496.1 unnamed protein product [Didymodactylos carnosus]